MDKLYTDLQVVDHGEGWQYRVDAVRESLIWRTDYHISSVSRYQMLELISRSE